MGRGLCLPEILRGFSLLQGKDSKSEFGGCCSKQREQGDCSREISARAALPARPEDLREAVMGSDRV